MDSHWGRIRRWGTIAAATSMLLAVVTVVAPPPAAAAFSNVSLVASNNQASATGVTYTLTFQAGLVDAGFAFVLPTGVTGLNTANVSVASSTNGTDYTARTLAGVDPLLVSGDGQRLGVNPSVAVVAGEWLRVTVTGLTNPAATGNIDIKFGGKATAVTQADLDVALVDTLLALLAETATVVLGIIAQVANGVTADVSVAPALSFSLGAASHSWSLDPAGTASSNSVTDTLTVSTNAQTYVLQASASGDLLRVGTSGADAADRIPLNGASNGPRFGYRVTGPAGDAVDATAFRNFGTVAAPLATGWSLTGLVSNEATTVTYDVGIDYTKRPGRYVTTLTYRVVPSY